MDSTFDSLCTLLVKDFGADSSKLSPSSQLTDAGLDSLAAMELMFSVEDNFKIKLETDGDNSIPATLGDLVKLIDSKLPAQAA